MLAALIIAPYGCSAPPESQSWGQPDPQAQGAEVGSLDAAGTGDASSKASPQDGSGTPSDSSMNKGDSGSTMESIDAGGAVDACGSIPSTLFTPTCAGTGCHNATDKANGLDLISPGVGARLVNRSAVGGPGKLIDATNPSQSVLLLKVQPNPPFGAQMPLLGTKLSNQQVECVREWIAAQLGASSGGG